MRNSESHQKSVSFWPWNSGGGATHFHQVEHTQNSKIKHAPSLESYAFFLTKNSILKICEAFDIHLKLTFRVFTIF